MGLIQGDTRSLDYGSGSNQYGKGYPTASMEFLRSLYERDQKGVVQLNYCRFNITRYRMSQT